MSDIQIQPEPMAITRVFVLLVVSTLILLWFIWLLTSGGTDLFEPQSYLHCYMPDASGLLKKAAVQLNGLHVGKVSAVKLSGLRDPRKVVWVEMRIKSRFLKAIPVDSTVSITADNLLGDKYLNITSGKRNDMAREGSELRSVLPIGDQFNSADLVAALKDELNRVDASIRDLENPETPIGNFVQSEDFYNQLRAEIVSVQQTIEKFAHPQSELGQMLFSDEFYGQIRTPIIAMEATLSALQAGEGQAGHLLASSEDYDELRRQLSEIRESLSKVNRGEGPAGEMIHSDQTYRQMQRLVDTIGRAVNGVNSGEGIGRLLIDTQMYESLSGSTRELKESVEDFRKNPKKYLRVKVF